MSIHPNISDSLTLRLNLSVKMSQEDSLSFSAFVLYSINTLLLFIISVSAARQDKITYKKHMVHRCWNLTPNTYIQKVPFKTGGQIPCECAFFAFALLIKDVLVNGCVHHMRKCRFPHQLTTIISISTKT